MSKRFNKVFKFARIMIKRLVNANFQVNRIFALQFLFVDVNRFSKKIVTLFKSFGMQKDDIITFGLWCFKPR